MTMSGLDLLSLVTLVLIIVVTWYFMRRSKNAKPLSYDKIDIQGKTVIITGGNSAIGRETAEQLAKLGARVILACRDVAKGNAVADDIRTVTNDANFIIKHLDLADLTSVKKFCDEIILEETSVDILINNAGVCVIPTRMLKDDTEMGLHFGQHLLTRLLLPLIQRSHIKRVVIVSSYVYELGSITLGAIMFNDDGQRVSDDGRKQYSSAKLMNCLFTAELHRRFASRGVVFNTTVDKGFPQTGVGFIAKPIVYIMKQFKAKDYQGCLTTMYCATAKGIKGNNGRYFCDSNLKPWDLKHMNEDMAGKVWHHCEDKVARFL